MYLEVTVGDERPVTYRLSRPEIAVGSLLSNEIIVSNPSISKKHLKIFFSEDRWYAVDVGSTNGSYMGEEKLVPNVQVEMSHLSEVRLGAAVYCRLLEKPVSARVLEFPELDEPPAIPDEIPHEKTVHLSIEEFKAAEAHSLERKRQWKRTKEPLIQWNAKSAMKTCAGGVVIILIAAFLNYSWKSLGNTARDEFIKLPKDAKTWSHSGSIK